MKLLIIVCTLSSIWNQPWEWVFEDRCKPYSRTKFFRRKTKTLAEFVSHRFINIELYVYFGSNDWKLNFSTYHFSAETESRWLQPQTSPLDSQPSFVYTFSVRPTRQVALTFKTVIWEILVTLNYFCYAAGSHPEILTP